MVLTSSWSIPRDRPTSLCPESDARHSPILWAATVL
jgi:hypothetical protein